MLNLSISTLSANKSEYKSLNIEYSDNKGQLETLNILVKDKYVYADANQLVKRLGYTIKMGENNRIVISNLENTKTPRMFLIFHVNDSKVDYYMANRVYQNYSAPVEPIKDNVGVWVPLQYTLAALNSSMLIVDNVVTVTMPKKTLNDIIYEVAANSEEFRFDYVEDIGYDNIDEGILTGANHLVNVFNGILTGEGESWAFLFQQFWGDFSAYDNKFGEEIVKLFCTNSDKELEAINEKISLLSDVFSSDGKLGEALSQIKFNIDDDVDTLYRQCNDLFKNIQNSNSDLSKYNSTYFQFERAFDKKTWFSDTGEVILNTQEGIQTATKTLDIIGKVAEVTGYLQEFSDKDDYSVNSLLNYFSEFSTSSMLRDDFISALVDNAQLFNSNIVTYSIARYIEDNIMDWLTKGFKVSEQLGAQGNLLLLTWNIAAATVPFIKNGLSSADSFELSLYSMMLQSDSFSSYVTSRDHFFSSEDTATATNIYKVSQYLYTYLKTCYITREAAIGSLDNVKNKPGVQDLITQQSKVNLKIANYLADLKLIVKDNKDGSMGFLPERSKWYVNNYDDSALLRVSESEKDQAVTSEKKSFNTDTEMQLKEKLAKSTSKPICRFNCDDFDNDGKFEAFAFVGEKETESYIGELWFVNQDSASKVTEMNSYWEINEVYVFGTHKFVVLSEYVTTGDVARVWGVRNGRPEEQSISGIGGNFSKIDDKNLTLTHSTYDSSLDGTGHTWKPYYFYWDENSLCFKEYGGIRISEAQLAKIDNATAILNAIKQDESGKITEIYYRGNDIININYIFTNENGTWNANTTLICDNGKLQKPINTETGEDNSLNGGIYQAEMNARIATYPDRFPY